MSDDFAAAVSGVSALAEPLRRRLYLYVASAPDAVGREEAAAACAVPVHTAKFHLDRLEAEGLLQVEFRRLTGRTGPGAGRPAKLYRRAAGELSVSLPGRSYDLAADLLALAVERAAGSGVPVHDELATAARSHGREVAARSSPPPSSGEHDEESDELRRVAEVVAAEGYEPALVEEELRLRNCPFDRLAKRHTELVCGMNVALVEGVTEELGCRHVHARLQPDPSLCCVRVGRAQPV